MPYTNNPSTNNNDALKFILGDQSTSSATELLSTKECSYLLTVYGSARAAAPHGARAIAADFADRVGKSVGDFRLDAQQKFEHYMSLARSLERQASFSAVPYAGGVSVSDKDSVEDDTDRVGPSFEIGLHDDPANPSQSWRSTST